MASTLACTAVTPCGRFDVHMKATLSSSPTETPQLTVRVFPHTEETPSTTATAKGATKKGDPLEGQRTAAMAPTAPSYFRLREADRALGYHYTASLGVSDVESLTESAGVRKSFRNFVEMVYSGLTGKAACVQFYVETVEEMKQRITRDIRQKQHTQQQFATDMNASSASCGGEEGEASHSLVHLSMHSDTAVTQALVQRFFTVDYNVDFTRAVFPIPLTMEEEHHTDPQELSKATRVRKDTEELIAMSGSEGEQEEEGEDVSALRQQLVEMKMALTDLHSRNQRLTKENSALQALCQDKMLAIKDMCARLHDHAETVAEVERLRRKNTDLRLRMRAAEEAHAESEKRLMSVMARGQQSTGHVRQPSQPQRDAYTSAVAPRRSLRELSPSPRPTGRPALSPSATRTGDDARDRARARGASADSVHRALTSRHRRPLVSPTPPPLSERHRHNSNRFDTPSAANNRRPSLARSSPRVGSQTQPPRRARQNRFDSDREDEGECFDENLSLDLYGGGGDAPAPRGRTGARPSLSRSPSRSTPRTAFEKIGSRASSIPNVYKTATRGRERDLGSRPHSRCSSVSSRASSTTSERLYRATTVSSRQRHDATLEDAVRRDPGRLQYEQLDLNTPSRRRSVFR